MLRAVHARLETWPPASVRAVALATVFLVGLADYITGAELSASVFYLLPVAVATWYVGGDFGTAVAFISAGVWYAADLLAGNVYSHPLIPVWNAGVRLAFFLIVRYLLLRLRGQLEAQRTLAETDGATGLVNARRFREAVRAEVERSRRYRHPLSLAYVDLDDFKAVNDRFGHDEGDRVLAAVAGRLKAVLRGSDTAARMGGDEFALLLPETAPDQARTVVEKLRAALEGEMERNGWSVGFSVGVITAGAPPPGVEALLQAADTAMYEAKRGGKRRTILRQLPAGSVDPATARSGPASGSAWDRAD